MEKLYGYWIHLIKIPLKKKLARMYSTAYVNFVLSVIGKFFWTKLKHINALECEFAINM